MTGVYKAFAWKTIATMLLVALVPLYLLGFTGYLYFSHLQEEKLEAELKNLAVNRSNAIGLFLDERISMLEVLVQGATLQDLTKNGTLAKTFGVLNRRTWSFLDLGLIDSQGRQLVYVGPYSLEDRNYADSEWFQKTQVKGVFVSDVFMGYREVPHFVVAVGRSRECAEGCWILRATIDSEVFTSLVRSAQVGQSGDAFIVNSEGKYQTPPRFGGKILSKANLDIKQVPPGINVVERVSASGKRILTAFAWLPKKGWLLVINQDPAEVLGPLTLGVFGLSLMGLGTLLIVASTVLLVHIMVRRLQARDRERADLDAQLAHSGRLVSLGRMAAGVAHEINNPLAAIGELAGLMDDLMDQKAIDSLKHGELFKDNLFKIQEHVDRARSVTHRLLGFARRMEPHWDQVDVNEVLDETLSFVEKEAMFKNVNIERRYGQGMPSAQTDRAQLQQVFLNLLDNAVDAVGQGGQVEVRSRTDNGCLEVAIADNGPGVAKQDKDRIMDPFFTTKPPGQGTGLGLSISHSIMSKLGGTLSFSSEPGQGATFFVRVPLVSEQRG